MCSVGREYLESSIRCSSFSEDTVILQKEAFQKFLQHYIKHGAKEVLLQSEGIRILKEWSESMNYW